MSSRSSSRFTTRSNYSESASSEYQPYADTLANQLVHLHEENLQIGKQNQELSVKLHEVTTYNQALGLDIYKLDNEISELEEKIESHREKTNKILHQTEAMNRKTETCKNRLNRNEQMSELAKKFQTISHFKEKADKNVQELRKLFEDSNYEKIASSFDSIAEKIHFLYWNNNELNEQISILEKMVSERENKDRTQLKNSWEERRIDQRDYTQTDEKEIKEDENKSESSQAGGASLRVKMNKRTKKGISETNRNNSNEEGECATIQIQSDASKKNEYFMSSDSIENEFKRKAKKKDINQRGNNDNTPNKQEQYTVNSPQSKKASARKNRKGKKSPKSGKTQNQNAEISGSEKENEYDLNEYDNQNQIKFDPNKMTPRKNLKHRKMSTPDSNKKENEDDAQINDYTSPNSKSSSTTYSKSSSKSSNSDKLNQLQSPNSGIDTSSQLADSSNSNHSNKTDNNDVFQQVQLVCSNSKVPFQNVSDGNTSYQNGRRVSRRKSHISQPHVAPIKEDSDSEYDYYESEPPPNPKKGTVRISKKDSEYEYEYYDPDEGNEEADDENEYDFVEESTAPPKVIISRPRDALQIAENRKKGVEPKVVTNYTECEYILLNFKKPEPVKPNLDGDAKLINLNSKYDDDENINHNDKSEYIYLKKSEKTIKEDELRAKQREFVSKTIIPKATKDELYQEKNDIFNEEQIKKYEESALQKAIEDENQELQIKIEKQIKIKNEEEQFIKECFRKLKIRKRKKREKMEQMKDEEIQSYKENKKYEKYYFDKVTEIINMKEQRSLNKETEEEEENKIKIEIRKKAQERIKKRQKEEEVKKEQENIKKMHEKEAEEKLKEEKRIKAQKFQEEEQKKLEQQQNEENENKEQEKQKRIQLLNETKQKEKEKIESERKKKEEEENENKEKEKRIIEDMKRRQKEREDKEKEENELEKSKKAKEVQILKNKILKFRELKEKERKQKEEELNNEKEILLIKEKLREKRRKNRDLRKKEKIERERKDRELRELYEGIFDVPVKRIFDKKQENEENSLKNDDRFRTSRLGNDREGFLSDSAGMSASDSMTELDVAAAVSLEEEEKLANLHEKNTKNHLHRPNCKRIKVKKNENSEYDYDYEYEIEQEQEQENNKKISNLSSRNHLNNSESEPESIILKTKNNNENKLIDEKEAEKIALEEQKRLQKLLNQMDNNNNQNKNKQKNKRKGKSCDSSSTSRFESDSSIVDVSQDKEKNENDSILNYNYNIKDESSISDVFQYSDDDYYPKPKPTVVSKSAKTKENDNKNEDDDELNKKGGNDDNLIIDKDRRPLRKKKAEKPNFVPEFYNPKQQPKFKPIVVGIVNSKNQTKNGVVVNEIENPESPKPVLIENCKIKHPVAVKMNIKDFELIKTPEQLKTEAEEKAAREERERLHQERAKKFRHTIDANGKEYEYDYEYDYEYENETENKEENENKDEAKSNNINNLHATYRDSTDFLNELSKEVENVNAVIKESTDVIKKKEEELKELKKSSRLSSTKQEEEEKDKEEDHTQVKRVRTGRKIKKSPSSKTTTDSNETAKNDTNSGIKRQRSVTFANNPMNGFDAENQLNFNPQNNNGSKTPPRRINASARRNRNSPGSPLIDPTTSPNSKKRISTRRLFRDTTSGDNNEEEDASFDDANYEDDSSELSPKSSSSNSNAKPLLVEIDSRPITPRSPQQQQQLSPNNNNTNDGGNATDDHEMPNVPAINLKGIQNFVDDDEYEYEYEYEEVDQGCFTGDDGISKNKSNFSGFKFEISENSSSFSANNQLHLQNEEGNVEDFTENEKAFDSHANFKLQNLVRQIRADAASISNEDIQKILTKIKSEIEVQQKSSSELSEKLEELEKIRDKKVPKTLSTNNEKIVEFDPIIYENKYQVIECQTEVSGDSIKNIETTLHKQNKEKQEMVAVQKRIEAAQQQVIATDNQIKTGEKLTIEKKQSIENLKKEIVKVKEELAQLNYDTTEDDNQAKKCEIEIEKIDTQIQQSQQKLEKVSHTIEELKIKLQEMINYRSVLEAELNDMYNREKPEVRKLIEDVRNTKQSSEEAQTKINQTQKKITTKRDEVAKLKNSKDRKKLENLKLTKEKLTRRLNKWSNLCSLKDLDLKAIQDFSVSNASQREKSKTEAYKNMPKIWIKQEEVQQLTKYADLLESILTEYNKQTPV